MKNLYIIGSVVGLGVAARCFLKYMNRQSNKLPSLSIINEVLFFPDTEYPCSTITKRLVTSSPEQRICYNPSCRKLHGRPTEEPSSLIKFLSYLSNAKKKVYISIYMLTQGTLADRLIDLHTLGREILIITDSGEDEGFNSQISRLRSVGIKIISNKPLTGALMHHKFVIIDDEILLTGSFNWTNKAVVSNYEAVIVTSEKSLVEPFIVEFRKMWFKFSGETILSDKH